MTSTRPMRVRGSAMTRDGRQLSREAIVSGVLNRLLTAPGMPFHALTEVERTTSLKATLASYPGGIDGAGVWLFAYGSLIWNPTFEYCEQSIGTIYGWHRRFCVGAPAGRGTLERPGLVLGLDRGGSCRGIVFRIAVDRVDRELDILWRREMAVDCYEPRWVRVAMKKRSAFAIAFVMKRNAPNYENPISEERLIRRIVAAVGELGSNAEYLLETVEGLRRAHVPDPYLERLAAAVEAKRSS
jgi:cation transport protein ChaC